MPQILPNDIYQVKLYCSLQNQLSINVLHYRCASITGDASNDAAFAARIDALFGPLYPSLLSIQARYRGAGVQRLYPQPPTVETFSTIQAADGLADEDPLPKQTCGVITKRTASAGRSYRGRAYIPFPAESANSADTTPSAGYLADLFALAAQMEDVVVVGAGLNVANMVPVIYHRIDGSTTDITDCETNDKWGTQRRRGDYGRQNPFPV